MYKIGIIGNGFVGSSVAFGFSPQTGCDGAEVKIYDKNEFKSTHTLNEVVNDSDYIFLSVPTPSNQDGSISLDILLSIFKDIDEVIDYEAEKQPVIMIRSTITPGTTAKIQGNYPRMYIVFNPEFLTERSAKFDFINQSRFIVGGSWGSATKVAHLYKWRFGDSIPIIKTDFQTAEMIKYMNNCFFATKVSFMNEMYQIAEKCGVDWKMAVEGFVSDNRIGHTHLAVPGPDGKFGFGGSCFPKDIQAMINFAKTMDINPKVLEGTWAKNLEVRPEEDWKELKGRAVVEEKA
jgi:nucleotide sugar dehydrogenase